NPSCCPAVWRSVPTGNRGFDGECTAPWPFAVSIAPLRNRLPGCGPVRFHFAGHSPEEPRFGFRHTPTALRGPLEETAARRGDRHSRSGNNVLEVSYRGFEP